MSSVRLRIVINSNNGISIREHRRVFDELIALLRQGIVKGIARVSEYAHQTLCGLRGHDDRLLAERNRLALSCGRCGRVTNGWELSKSPRPYASPSRHHATTPGPRLFQMARRRS